MCRLNADDPVSMCQKNAAVAAALSRSDLVQVKADLCLDSLPVHYINLLSCVSSVWYLWMNFCLATVTDKQCDFVKTGD